MTYMGVLESVKLKQDNFPFRKKYEDFYKDYELLSEHFAVERYDQMAKNSDFIGFSKKIVLDCMHGLGEEFYALGKTKVLMMPEAKAVVDAAKKIASASRNKAADLLKRAYLPYWGAEKANSRHKAIHKI
jgi:myosin heavy subunit